VLAALLVSVALVVVVAPVALAPVDEPAYADAPVAVGSSAPSLAASSPMPSSATSPSPAASSPSPSSSSSASPSSSPSAEPSAGPAPRSPIGGTNGKTVRLDLAGPRDYVAQTNLVQCVGASVQMMLNIIKPGADRTAAYQRRLQVQARSLSGPKPPGFVRYGASVIGWAATLERRGGGDYEVVGADTLQQAMRIAARSIHDERRPVGLLVWRGRHAWVMSGYEAVVDRTAPGGFRVTRADVLDPLHPYGGSTVWGASPKPGSSISVKAVGRQFVRREPRPGSPWTIFWRSIPGNAALEGKYVLVVPVPSGGAAAG
jgi:hypothetical protein